MKNLIFKYTISTDKSQKCQKYDLFGEFYGRKWSEITPQQCTYHYSTPILTRINDITSKTTAFLMKKLIFKITISTDISLKMPKT